MAEKGGGGASFGPFFLLLLIIIILVVVNSGTSGFSTPNVSFPEATPGESTTVINTSKDTVGTSVLDQQTGLLVGDNSGLFSRVSILNGNLYTDDPTQEYLELGVDPNAKAKTVLTGMKIASSVSGNSVVIGKGVYRPFFSSLNIEDPISLNPGDTVYLISGRSPVGYSFRENKCTGYFSQFHDFYPYLPQECPAPSSYGYPGVPLKYKNSCYDYIDSLPYCYMPLNFLPEDLGPECTSYISSKLNYDTCVEKHSNDSDFYKPVWYVYLNRPEHLWDSRREFIKLLDQAGKTVNYLDLR